MAQVEQRAYAVKMDQAFSQTIRDWWLGLSKEELLEYFSEQPDITADVLREMISTLDCTLAFDVRFSASSHNAVTDFHTAPSEE